MRNSTKVWRKYSLNECAFDTDSPERDYFFGLLLADGCICKTNRSQRHVVLVSTESDKETVDKFRIFLGSNQPVQIIAPSAHSYTNSKPYARFYVASDRLADKLEELGISERKSGIATMPERFLDNCHAWRGFVDGDGWVLVSKDRSRPIIGICGGKDICQQFSDFSTRLGIGMSMLYPNGNIWTAQLNGRKATAMIKCLYEKPGPAMRRKQIVAHAILASYWGIKEYWSNSKWPKANILKVSR